MKAVSLGLAGGILWGAMMFLTTIVSVFTGYADGFLMVMSSIYPGFTVTIGGAFVGLVYGFVDAFVGLLILGWLYQLFSGCCCKKNKQ